MENNKLRTPLIYSAILLAVVSLIIFLTVSSPGGSIWGAIGSIFYTIFKAVQLTIGLVLALLVCLAVLVGIFFGCVAMVSRENAARMYRQLLDLVPDQFDWIKSRMPGAQPPEPQELSREAVPGQTGGGAAAAGAAIESIRRTQGSVEEKLNMLQSRIEQYEKDESVTKLSEWLRAEEQKTGEVQAAMELLEQRIGQLQEKIDVVAEKMAADSSADALSDVRKKIDELAQSCSNRDADVQALEQKVGAIKEEDLAAMQNTLAGLEEKLESRLETGESDEHRLFSYIEDEQEKEKIQQLVTEAMEQEMTYAQATDHIVENVAPDTAKVIAEHPALTKEFIREHRKQN